MLATISAMLALVVGWFLLVVLAGTTVVFSVAARWGYYAFDRRARRLGRLDPSTLF